MMKLFSRKEFAAIGEAAARFLDLLPALLLALLCLRAAELASGMPPGAALREITGTAGIGIGLDLVTLARYLPGLFLVSLPFLLLRSRRAGFWGLGLAWSLLVLLQASLVQYFLAARVPLGADLYAYSLQEIGLTLSGGAGVNIFLVAGAGLGLAGLWTGLALLSRRAKPLFSPRAAGLSFAVCLLVLAAAPKRLGHIAAGTEDSYNLVINKAAYFFEDSLAGLVSPRTKAGPAPSVKPAPAAAAGLNYTDPAYPFLRAEKTPDVLGAHFRIHASTPPNLVFILVEGLGRSFSGPGAELGSFTPQLDLLAENSLYWENFLAVQGRTFALLPSVFGSLPFGDKGFSALGKGMPAHASLFSVLKSQGYRLKYYAGFDLDFDNERAFLERPGMDVLVDQNNFGPDYSRANSWGYADGDLVSRALADEERDTRRPSVLVLQTITMHTPYTFPGQDRYRAVFERRLEELGVSEERKKVYRARSGIYESILYTDAALARFFEQAKKNPAYQDTVFIVTGDHRLPEIPMGTRIARYHVPLIIFSPLLKAPARIKSVSSHLDLAPSLLAFLSNNYGLRAPRLVAWLGSGLDMEASFRNIHELPLKQTKTNLVDYLSGTWFLNQDTLYKLSDGMTIEPAADKGALARVRAQFAAFKAANGVFANSLALAPEQVPGQLGQYREEDRAKATAAAPGTSSFISVSSVLSPGEAKAGQLAIEAVFSNSGKTAAGIFIPLVVLLAPDGRELSESYAPRQKLPPGRTVSLKIQVKSRGVAPGRYFLAVIPSDPNTGKSAGKGRYHIPVRIH